VLSNNPVLDIKDYIVEPPKKSGVRFQKYLTIRLLFWPIESRIYSWDIFERFRFYHFSKDINRA